MDSQIITSLLCVGNFKICSENDVRICLDVSHRNGMCRIQLAASDFVNEVGKYVAHSPLMRSPQMVALNLGRDVQTSNYLPVGHPMP